MNYSRIVFFSVGLYLLLVALSAIATLIIGVDDAIQSMSFTFALHILSFLISLIMYFYLGYKQTANPYKQAIFVAVAYWFVDLSISVLFYIFLEISIVTFVFLISALLHVIAVLLGTLLGVQLRNKRELT